MQVSLPINTFHSMADIITNSSTEIFIIAGDNTIAGIKELINALFKVAGSETTCDDVFTIEYDWERYVDYYFEDDYERFCEDNDGDSENFIEAIFDESIVGSETHKEVYKKKYIAEFTSSDFNPYKCAYYRERRIKVTADDDNPYAIDAAKILSNLTGLFEIEATQN